MPPGMSTGKHARYVELLEANMAETGPEAGAKGIVEDAKGKVKEAAGALSGDQALKSEGQAQQDKAGAEREVAQKEAEAEKARWKEKAYEAEQRSHQR